jgi:hypothetical protein
MACMDNREDNYGCMWDLLLASWTTHSCRLRECDVASARMGDFLIYIIGDWGFIWEAKAYLLPESHIAGSKAWEKFRDLPASVKTLLSVGSPWLCVLYTLQRSGCSWTSYEGDSFHRAAGIKNILPIVVAVWIKVGWHRQIIGAIRITGKCDVSKNILFGESEL